MWVKKVNSHYVSTPPHKLLRQIPRVYLAWWSVFKPPQVFDFSCIWEIKWAHPHSSFLGWNSLPWTVCAVCSPKLPALEERIGTSFGPLSTVFLTPCQGPDSHDSKANWETPSEQRSLFVAPWPDSFQSHYILYSLVEGGECFILWPSLCQCWCSCFHHYTYSEVFIRWLNREIQTFLFLVSVRNLHPPYPQMFCNPTAWLIKEGLWTYDRVLLKLGVFRILATEKSLPNRDALHLLWSTPSAKQGHGQTAPSPALQVHQPKSRLACSDTGPEESGSTWQWGCPRKWTTKSQKQMWSSVPETC